MSEHKVKVDGGKYTFHNRGGWNIDVLRHGEPWIDDIDAPTAVFSLMCELDAARVVLQAVRNGIGLLASPDVGRAIADALKVHDALVDDREPPSEWCEPAVLP